MKKPLRVIALMFLCVVAPLANADGPGEFGDNATASRPKDLDVNGRLEIIGTVAYIYNNFNQTIRFGFERLENTSSHSSGAILVRMILTSTPLSQGQNYTFWTLGEFALDPLLPGQSHLDVANTVPMAVPPDGEYFIYIASFEFEANPACVPNGYCLDDFVPFSRKIRVTNGILTDFTPPIPDDPTTLAIEYFHAGFGHYFVTADPAEIAGLDAGAYDGAFQRTGQQWKVWRIGPAFDMCRFFTAPGAFGTKSSHFYTAIPAECSGLKLNPVWIYENIAFKVLLPFDGACPAGTQILYRLYNNGQTGAPNHRYTVSPAIRSQMIAQGFVPEDSNNSCVPL